MKPANLPTVTSFRAVLSGLLVLGALSGCSKVGFSANAPQSPATPTLPVVAGLQTREVSPAPASAFRLAQAKNSAALNAGVGPINVTIATPSANPVVISTVKLNKASLLNRIFLYGSDLQYSSISDSDLSLIQQSQSVGHVPVYFRIVDNTLQMLQDQKNAFESDVNHPERLIHAFSITAQDTDTVTVEFAEASPVLNTVVSGNKAAPVRTSWVRSVEFIPNGEYLNFETSIELADGTIAEFMETFFPRDTVIPKDAQPLLADPKLEPLAERYRFLGGDDIFLDIPGKGRIKTHVASRFASTPNKTIDWYITPNAPDEYLPEIKTAIEGWNRYSQAMWSRDILAFKGRLPDGVKIGDPRYNVVNWDSVADAGAAYESQATDPYTGLTTHSMIYLPKAWVNIGKTYWDIGGNTEALSAKTEQLRQAFKNSTFLGHALAVNCIEDPYEKISLESRVDSVTFSKELLKGVLFHEIGHSLGFAHNFKGSLSFDPNDPKSSFSTSIMDYNQYQLEKAAFTSLDGNGGPLLEYDRQIMSVLYNQGKDVLATDPKLPACADTEADDEAGGQDPLCIRYDAGHDPTLQLSRTIDLLKTPTTTDRDTLSLPMALQQLSQSLSSAPALKDKDGASKAVETLTTSLSGVVNFYYAGGAQALSYMSSANIRSLRSWKPSILPKAPEYVEADMRKRAMDGIRYAVTIQGFEPETKAAIESFKTAARNWLASSSYITAMPADQQELALDSLLKGINAAPASLELAVLTKLRTRVFGDLKASSGSPYDFVQDGAQSIDFEHDVAQLLAQAVTDPLSNGHVRARAERIAAATALKTFADTAVGSGFLQDTVTAIQTQEKSARDLTSRTDAVAVLQALTK